MISPRRILLIQLRAIGDVILTTPAIRVLRKHFPNAQIDFLAIPAPAEALAGNPHLNQIITYPYPSRDALGLMKMCLEVRRRDYDLAIDFLGTPATAIMTLASGAKTRVGYRLRLRRLAYTHHEVGYRGNIYNALAKFSLLKPLGIEAEQVATEIFVPPEAADWAARFFEERGLTGQRVVAVAPAAKRIARQWLPERFAQVASWLQEQGCKVVLLWGPGEEEYVASVQKLISPAPILSPETTLMRLAAVLQSCRLLLCNCGGTKHVAVAAGTPTFTIHGPTDPRVWTPPNDPKHGYIRDDSESLEKITAQRVIQEIKKMGLL